MATTTSATKKKPSKSVDAQVALMLANGVPPNYDAMRNAATLLKIPIPAGATDAANRELLGSLRIRMKELLAPVPEEQQLVCEHCGERSTDATEYCPFCGDLGVSGDEQTGTALAVADAEPTEDVEGKLANLETELTEKLKKLSQLKLGLVENSYDMGVLVKEIHDRQLWKVKGYLNFKMFAEKELPFSRTTAYQLVQIVEKFDRKTYLEVGFRKLRTIAAVDDASTREQLVEEAKSGASVKQIDAKTRPARTNGKAEAKEKGEAKTAPPAEERSVTLLGRIDGKVHQAKFKSAKDGKRIPSAGKVTMVVAEAYAEIEITKDVYQRIGLCVQGKDVVAVSVEFVRAPT